MTDWTAAWAALAKMDGKAWDDESERIEALWLDGYRTAFVDRAMSRGWSLTNAADWAYVLCWMALVDIDQEDDPAKAAHKDVIKTEKERG